MTSNRSTNLGAGRGRLALPAAAAGMVAFAVLAVVAAGPPRPASPPQSATPAATRAVAPGAVAPAPGVDRDDAAQVCAAFAAALFTVVAGDVSPWEVYRRAAAYATGELAAALVSDQGRLPVPQQRPTSGGVDVASYVGDHMRVDTDGVAYRAALVTVTRQDGNTAGHVVYCTLTQGPSQWLVAGYELERSLQ